MKSLDEILCRLNNCINELDDIFDDLTYGLGIEATDLVKSEVDAKMDEIRRGMNG